jgi:hypothetical protein
MTLLYNLREIRHEVGLVALIGLLLSIVGTKLYDYPQGLLPVPGVVSKTLLPVVSGVLLPALAGKASTLDILVLVLSQAAYLAGLVIAVVFLWRTLAIVRSSA